VNKKTLSICYTVLLVASSYSQYVVADEKSEGILIQVKSKEVINSKQFKEFITKKGIKLGNDLESQNIVTLHLASGYKDGFCEEIGKKFSEILSCTHAKDLTSSINVLNSKKAEECDFSNQNEVQNLLHSTGLISDYLSKEFVISALKEGRSTHIPDHLKNDREIALAAVRANGDMITFFPKFHNDKEIILAAVEWKPDLFKWASEKLKNDKEFVLKVLKNQEFVERNLHQSISNKLLDDKEVFLEVARRGNGLQFFSKKLLNDKAIMLEAVRNNSNSVFRAASQELKEDKEFVLAALRETYYKQPRFSSESDKGYTERLSRQRSELFKSLSKKLQTDQEVKWAYEKKPNEVQDVELTTGPVSNDLSKEFVILALKEGRLTRIPDKLKNDREVALAAVRANGDMITFFPKFHNDKEIILAAIEWKPGLFKWASEKLKNDKEFVLKVLKNQEFVELNLHQSISNKLLDDKEVFLEVAKRARGLQFFSKRLLSDKAIMSEAVRNNSNSVFQAASQELKEDKEFVLAALRETYYKQPRFSTESDKGYTERLSRERSELFKSLSKKLQTDQEVKRAYETINGLVVDIE
jgi:hypothetical protein